MLTAIITLSMPGPMTATMAMASRMLGKASIRSIRRMIRLSVQPPRYPAHRPSRMPAPRAAAMAKRPRRREMRAP